MEFLLIMIMAIFLVLSCVLVFDFISRSCGENFSDESEYIKTLTILNCKAMTIIQVLICATLLSAQIAYGEYRSFRITTVNILQVLTYSYMFSVIIISSRRNHAILLLEYKCYKTISRINNVLKTIWLFSMATAANNSSLCQFFLLIGYFIFTISILKQSMLLWEVVQKKIIRNDLILPVVMEAPLLKRYTHLRFCMVWVLPVCASNLLSNVFVVVFFMCLYEQSVLFGFCVLFISVLYDEVFYVNVSKRLNENIRIFDTHEEYYRYS